MVWARTGPTDPASLMKRWTFPKMKKPVRLLSIGAERVIALFSRIYYAPAS
jgi:hypothetical protein